MCSNRFYKYLEIVGYYCFHDMDKNSENTRTITMDTAHKNKQPEMDAILAFI